MRSAPTRVASLLLAALVASCPLAAATLELPAEWPLGVDSHLLFELDGAELHFTTRTDALPVLQATAPAGESAGLDVTSSGGCLTVRRAGGAGEAPRLRIDVVLGPGYTVRVAGADLAVRAEDLLSEDSGGSTYRLAVERSTVDLTGVRISELEAAASSVALTGTQGILALTLEGGSAVLRGHRGRLVLAAAGADVTVADHHGQIVPDARDGSLEITGGEGTFSGTAAGAHLTFDDWRGPVELRARDTVVEARGAEHRARWQIDGIGLQLVLERIHGTVEATLEGGSLRASDLAAGVEVTAAGTRIDLVESAGGVRLTLAGAADAVLADLLGGVEAEVSDSRLEVDQLDQLRLTGARAEVSVRRLARLESLEIRDSELALDLRGVGQGPKPPGGRLGSLVPPNLDPPRDVLAEPLRQVVGRVVLPDIMNGRVHGHFSFPLPISRSPVFHIYLQRSRFAISKHRG